MSGIALRTRLIVLNRDTIGDLIVCQKCGRTLGYDGQVTRSYSLQHRLARGMGGSDLPDINSPANLVTLCGHATEPGRCHQWCEKRSFDAFNEGYVLRHPQKPAEVPVLTVRGWVLLDNNGGWAACPEPDPWNTTNRTDEAPF